MHNFDVKKLRKISGLTQDQLAELVGVSRNTIYHYENGGKIPSSKRSILTNLMKQYNQLDLSNENKKITHMNSKEIKEFREKYDLTQNELAEICGVGIRAVQSWEQGKRNITLSDIMHIQNYAKIIDYSLSSENKIEQFSDDTEKYILLKSIEKMTSTADKMAETADRNSKSLEKLIDQLIESKKNERKNLVQEVENYDAAINA